MHDKFNTSGWMMNKESYDAVYNTVICVKDLQLSRQIIIIRRAYKPSQPDRVFIQRNKSVSVTFAVVTRGNTNTRLSIKKSQKIPQTQNP